MFKYTIFSLVIAGTLVGAALFVSQGATSPIAQAAVAFCGDGTVNQPTEECDGSAGCTSGCKFAFCGDGVVNQSAEQCDGSAGVTSGYRCSSGCILTPTSAAPFCGDGVINQPAEECDGGSSCTSGCKLAVTPPCTSNCGGGGGGGGGGYGGYVLAPKLDVMQYGAVPQTTRSGNVMLAIIVKSIGTQPSENVELAIALPSDLTYTGGVVHMTRTLGSSISTSTAARVGGNIQAYNTVYQHSFRVGTLAIPENAIVYIPLRAADASRLGTITVDVFARKTNGYSQERDTKAIAKVLVISPAVARPTPAPKPIVKATPKPVAKPVVVAKAPTTVCISTEEYARLKASSSIAQATSTGNTNSGLLAAVGGLFDLGTGSTCFGLIILLLIILALVIIARLLYHYFEQEEENGEGDGQMPLIQ